MPNSKPFFKVINRNMRSVHLLSGLMLSVLGVLVCACSQEETAASADSVPLELRAAGDALLQTSTRAAGNLPDVAFGATVALSMQSGEYTDLTDEYEGTCNADVSTDGSVSWKTGEFTPEYPLTGDWVCLVAVSPQAVPADGNVSYTLTGAEDLLYAAQLQGGFRDGFRFSGNTISEKDKPMLFNHLLTRLQFKACKKEAGGLAVKITSVKVNEAKTSVTLPLATGIPVFSGPEGITLQLADDGVEVTEVDPPVSVGNLLLPPLQNGSSYTLDVETSIGSFQNIPIAFGDDAPSDKFLQAGMSHEITLSITDTSLGIQSVQAVPWELVSVDGEIDLAP